MEQRSLRLGDIVDDYCPRERRLTNHAVVAIVEGAIRQTRCTTCDYEHVYKQAREPKRRKAAGQSLFEQVMTDVAGGRAVPARIVTPSEADVRPPEPDIEVETPAEVIEAALPLAAAEPAPHRAGEDVWPGHRTLIRATLPRLSGDAPPARPIPEFTMHQKPQSARTRNARLIYGPQGDPFGRPTRDGQSASGRGAGDGQGGNNGNASGEPGNQPTKRRGRRRRRGGKRSH